MKDDKNTIYLGKYKEFGNSDISMKDCFEDGPYEHKDEILKYMDNCTPIFVRISARKDVFTGESLKFEDVVFEDGDYCWDNELLYYIEKYNLRLPADFENYVLERIKENKGKRQRKNKDI